MPHGRGFGAIHDETADQPPTYALPEWVKTPDPGGAPLVRGRNGSVLSSTAAFGPAFMRGSPHGVLCLRDRTTRRGLGAA